MMLVLLFVLSLLANEAAIGTPRQIQGIHKLNEDESGMTINKELVPPSAPSGGGNFRSPNLPPHSSYPKHLTESRENR
ncbi:hypothetical protein LINPERHAP1_LOCUS35352, partial [Linum perenne]